MANISEKENFQIVLEGKIPEWLPYYNNAVAGGNPAYTGRKPVAGTNNVVDVFGIEYHSTIDGPIPTNTMDGDFQLKDVTKWRDVMPKLDLKGHDWEGEAKGILSGIDRGKVMVSYMFGGMWETMHYIMGVENALASLLEEPEATFDFLDALADFWIDVMRRFCRFLKPDIVTTMEHIATHQGLLMSPETYRRVIKPAHKKAYDAIRELGAIPQMHVDGRIGDVMEDYAELGVRMIQPFQVFNDINFYKEKYDVVAVGGWDAFGPGNLPGSTEEDTRASVRLAMDTYGPGGRYAFWNSGATPRYPDRLKWIDDEAEKYGRDFYKKR
ncbi:MAG: hypothetical protein FWG28_01130 [Clostridiales bacterium]|nr:hypothetical protein [Clostridiales bacterium]